jgi:hypothetical protein
LNPLSKEMIAGHIKSGDLVKVDFEAGKLKLSKG